MREIAGHTYEEVGKGIARFGAVDVERAVERGIGMLVDLIQMKLAAKFQGVRADDLRKSVVEIQRVVHLRFVGDRNAHDERRKRDVFHAFELRRLDKDARGRRGETLRCQADAQASFRLSNYIGIAEKTDVGFVHAAGTESSCVSQADKFGLTECERVKTGDAGSALLAGIRIVEAVIVEKIVSGKLAPSGVSVNAARGFIVAHRFRISRSGKLIGAGVGRGNVLEQIDRRG